MKNKKYLIYLGLDFIMATLFIVALGYGLTGGLVHEWLGLIFSAIVIFHVFVNWRSFINFFGINFLGLYKKQKLAYAPLSSTVVETGRRWAVWRRFFSLTINILLFISVVVIFISGAINSHYIFDFFNFKGSFAMRQIHSFAAYWGLVLLGLHIGWQWGKVMGILKSHGLLIAKSVFTQRFLFTLTVAIVAYGLWASFDRAMGEKLFFGSSFDFWDHGQPQIFFYTHNLAIMALYIVISHYVKEKILPKCI
ncbi:MAG: DUF4405 domain-containing protein [Candidatus Adiutrix sp.]